VAVSDKKYATEAKNMLTGFQDAWVGQPWRALEKREYSWGFDFGAGNTVTADCPWRILDASSLRLTDSDHGQSFGHPAPIDATRIASDLLSGARVSAISIDQRSGDLHVGLDNGLELQLINNSSGYEAWHATAARAEDMVHIVAQGGGEIALWCEAKPLRF
jgi:hypothetical protein